MGVMPVCQIDAGYLSVGKGNRFNPIAAIEEKGGNDIGIACVYD